jgi:hypothetical protein
MMYLLTGTRYVRSGTMYWVPNTVCRYSGIYHGTVYGLYNVLRRYIRYSSQDFIESSELNYSRPIQVVTLFTADIKLKLLRY